MMCVAAGVRLTDCSRRSVFAVMELFVAAEQHGPGGRNERIHPQVAEESRPDPHCFLAGARDPIHPPALHIRRHPHYVTERTPLGAPAP